jgi:AcrR family transcriptional regulator
VPLSKTLTGAPSLREAHKSRTLRALRGVALKLFAAQGYDTTTTEQIAKKAGVSARTFFRYFPTKESVLFLGEPAWVQSFVWLYRGQPDSHSDVDAMCATLIELASGLARDRQSLLLYERAVASSPTLRGRVQDRQVQTVEKVAEAIAARRGLPRADEASTLLAAVGVLTFRRALDAWLAGPAGTQLGEVIASEFRLLTEAFTQGRAKPKRRPAASQQDYPLTLTHGGVRTSLTDVG